MRAVLTQTCNWCVQALCSECMTHKLAAPYSQSQCTEECARIFLGVDGSINADVITASSCFQSLVQVSVAFVFSPDADSKQGH